jgi:hypothetical protein
MTGTSQ